VQAARAALAARVKQHPRLWRAAGKLDAVVRYWPHMRARPRQAIKFLLQDPEYTNYTYEIANRDELAEFLGTTLQVDPVRVAGYVAELEGDAVLREELARLLSGRPDRRNIPLYGRRVGWYALVRLARPRLIVEVGVHDGLGAAVLLEALYRNHAEGYPGRLIGVDLDPASGWLVPSRLRDGYELIVEHSAKALPKVVASREPVSLFIADGDHSEAGEYADYVAVQPGLARDAILLTDNARTCNALKRFAAANGRPFAFWAEQSVDHFWPGEGIGLSLPPNARETATP
jgi:predicted O-methyltransferase YrrM